MVVGGGVFRLDKAEIGPTGQLSVRASTKHLSTTLDMPAKPADSLGFDFRGYCIQGSTGSVHIGPSYTISKLLSFEA